MNPKSYELIMRESVFHERASRARVANDVSEPDAGAERYVSAFPVAEREISALEIDTVLDHCCSR